MSYEVDNFEHNGLRVRIIQDEDASNPEEYDCPVYLAHFHRQFETCNDALPFSNAKGFQDFLNEPVRGDFNNAEDYHDAHDEWREEREQWAVFLVSAYIHSGVVLALAGSIEDARFPDRQWDVSHVGAVLVKKDGEWGEDVDFEEIARGHLEAWNQYLSGDVWGYVVDRAVRCEHCGNVEYEDVDSCWSFYGIEDCKEAAMKAAKGRAS